MSQFFDNTPMATPGRWALAVAIVLLGLVVATGANATEAPCEDDAEEACTSCDEVAGADDCCAEDCPQEDSGGDCVAGCQQCSCCSAMAPSLVSNAPSLATPHATSARAAPRPTDLAPTGVARGLFKPPRSLTA